MRNVRPLQMSLKRDEGAEEEEDDERSPVKPGSKNDKRSRKRENSLTMYESSHSGDETNEDDDYDVEGLSISNDEKLEKEEGSGNVKVKKTTMVADGGSDGRESHRMSVR